MAAAVPVTADGRAGEQRAAIQEPAAYSPA